jgi:hypothetical protein
VRYSIGRLVIAERGETPLLRLQVAPHPEILSTQRPLAWLTNTADAKDARAMFPLRMRHASDDDYGGEQDGTRYGPYLLPQAVPAVRYGRYSLWESEQ